MQLIKLFAAMGVVICLAGNMACKKKEVTSYGMKTTVNGLPFVAADCSAQLLIKSLFITGFNPSDSVGYSKFPQFTLIVLTNGTPTTGTYVIDGVNNQAIIDSSAYNHPSAVYGTITITSVTGDVTGSFNFTCSDSTKVINGSFAAEK